MRFTHDNRILRDRRRELRKNSTKPEQILWFELRHSKLGVKFKRQHSIGGYITDFYCAAGKLVIELDGAIHNTTEAQEYDRIRDNYFKELGLKVLRFQNDDAEKNTEQTLEKIRICINSL